MGSSPVSDGVVARLSCFTLSQTKYVARSYMDPQLNSIHNVEAAPESFEDCYSMTDQILGKGAFSIVYLGHNLATDEPVAVKVIQRKDMSKDDEKGLKREVKIMKNMTHQNIVALYDFFEDDKAFYLVMEHMAGGQLFDKIIEKTVYTESEARDTVLTIVQAIKYCHDKFVVHRDIKPENLLLSTENSDSVLKLADFGLAVKTIENILYTECGTPAYIAPEILGDKGYGKAVDMWSIGVITYILLGGYPPFYDEDRNALFNKIRSGAFTYHAHVFANVSVTAKDFINRLLTVDPNTRMTAEEALGHSWLSKSSAELRKISLMAGLSELKARGLKHLPAAGKLRVAANFVIAANKFRQGIVNKPAV